MTKQELIELDKLVEKLATLVNERGWNGVLMEAVDVVKFYVGIEYNKAS